MSTYLEDYNNPFIQIFHEFHIFLFTAQYDCKSNKMLSNVILDSKKIHIRALCEFFSNQRNTKDDFIYKDFISSSTDLSVDIDKTLRTFINKNTAHISKQRGNGTINVPDGEFLKVQQALIKSINRFIGELDNHVCDKYKDLYNEKDVQNIKSSVLTQILKITLYNVSRGVHIDL